MHRLIALLLLALLAATGARAAEPEAPVLLRTQVTVDGAMVRLGDLFEGAGARADTPIARAPEPGRRVEVDARWLAAVARAYGLAWRPASRLERAVIERTSTVIDTSRIEHDLTDALARRGVAGRIALVLDNPGLRLHLPSHVPPTLAITGLAHDPGSGRFTAHLAAPAEGTPIVRATVTGRALETAEVPVLRRRVEPGEVIGRGDIDWVDLRVDRIGRNAVIDAANLVGKSPRRPLRPGEPILGGELRAPLLVTKNGLVTIRLETERLHLTAQGRALEAGARDEVIRVVNTKSNKVLSAVIIDNGTVAVIPAATPTLASIAPEEATR